MWGRVDFPEMLVKILVQTVISDHWSLNIVQMVVKLQNVENKLF